MTGIHDDGGSPEPTPDDAVGPRPGYDFRALKGATHGRYTAVCAEWLRVVRIADDVASAFAG